MKWRWGGAKAGGGNLGLRNENRTAEVRINEAREKKDRSFKTKKAAATKAIIKVASRKCFRASGTVTAYESGSGSALPSSKSRELSNALNPDI